MDNRNYTKPLISIITVCFNSAKTIRQTIESVLNQTYTNIEYILIDGKSTDNTVAIIQEYAPLFAVKGIAYRWVSEPDNGLSDAMNKGVAFGEGDYFILMHSDDRFTTDGSVRTLVGEIEATGKQWVTGFYRYMNSKEEITRCDKFKKSSWLGMLVRNIIRHQATMVSREIAKTVLFKPNYKYAMDYDYFLYVWKHFGSPHFICDYIADFRLDGTNLSSNFIASITDELDVRCSFRIKNKQIRYIFLDLIIFYARILKIYLIHNRRKKAIVK